MKFTKSILILLLLNCSQSLIFAQIFGVDCVKEYYPFLKDKNVGLVVNFASKVNNTHLTDSLLSLGINVSVIFSPEHGISGTFNAGQHVDNS